MNMELRDIILLVNYKNGFGNKYDAVPLHSGFDKALMADFFKQNGYNVKYLYPSQVDIRDPSIKGKLILYTSTEDSECLYKQYIEDIVYALTLKGAVVIPDYMFLKAHHNKVFMEMLRDISNLNDIKNIVSWHYGALEEFEHTFNHAKDSQSWVIKSAAGASSMGVRLSNSRKQLYHYIKKLSYSKEPLIQRFKELLRPLKYKGYTAPSVHRHKFVIQNFVNGLGNDWKVLVYGEKFFVVRRPNRANDFRASGSGKPKYKFGKNAEVPDGMLDFAYKVYTYYNVPMISLDIAYKDGEFYLIEMQFVAFGNSGHHYSKEYFINENSKWITATNNQPIEQVYVDAIVAYIRKNNL